MPPAAPPTTQAPAAPTAWPSAPAPYAAQPAYAPQSPYGAPPVVPEPEDVPAYDRPLTEAEWGLLKGGLNAQKVKLPRFLAAFIGIMPLAMIFMAFMGAPFIPEDFMGIVLVTGILGLALGLAARGAGAPISGAMRRGVAREVYGVPEVAQASATTRTVALGGVTFTMGNALADRLLPDRMNRITYTTAGVLHGGPKTAAAMAGHAPAWVLDWNGTPSPKLEPVTVDEAGKIPDMPGVSAPPPGRGPR